MSAKPFAIGLAAAALVAGGGYLFRDSLPGWATSVVSSSLKDASASTQRSAHRSSRRSRGRGPRAVPVTLGTVEQRSAPKRLLAIGTVQAVATVSVKSRVDGQIMSAGFREGQTVHKGDLLFRLDPRPFEVALRQAQANLARDRAQLVKAGADLKRYGELMSRGFASQQKNEEVKAGYASLQETIRADQAAVDAAKLQLNYAVIRSPIDGRTGSILVSPGNLVKANDSSPLVVITQLRPIYLSFSVPERHLGEIRRLMAAGKVEVAARAPGDPEGEHHGVLSFINNMVDVSTGTIQLKATFANGDEALTPGEFVNVALTVKERPNAIVVPASAVQTGQSGTYVFVAKPGNTVEMRPVKVADQDATRAVIDSGLQPGEKIVLDGQIDLVPGSHITTRGGAGADRQPGRTRKGGGRHGKARGEAQTSTPVTGG